MRRLLDRIFAWGARRNRLRVVMDHVCPTREYLHRLYLAGGGLDDHGNVRHSRVEVCLHRILVSDADWLHSHPTATAGIILAGSYREHTPEGALVRRPGYIRIRGPKALHRLELIDAPVYTLFIFLNRVGQESKWGFLVNGKMVPHQLHLKEHA